MSSLYVSSETAGPVFTRFHMGPSVQGLLSICLSGSALLNKMATVHKTHKKKNGKKKNKKKLKNLLQNQESFEAECLYIASGMQGLPSLFK